MMGFIPDRVTPKIITLVSADSVASTIHYGARNGVNRGHDNVFE